ncbi:efflux RND transporter periplasmic adaptor subunit [Pectobacterium actinidiae]|uniref:efflux RND transporter periplasmic adaptor subunit n=1 Tax=Pectobacterium actinidiae TaxID=1507808 RepID=UPI003811B374
MRINILFILFSSALLTACDNHADTKNAPPQTPRVEVLTLSAEPVTLSSMLPGRTVSVRTAEVRPQVDGIILKRFFQEGAEVKSGEQLYQIDPATYQAAFNKAKATLINAEALANRYKSLSSAHAISAQDYDDAVSKAAQARADLDTARINLEYTKVKAPISGTIDRSLFTEGALVTNGQSSYLTTITQLNPIYIDISESSRNILKLRKMFSEGKLKSVNDHEAFVQLIMEDGSVYNQEGRLEFSEVRVDESTGSVALRATFPNPDRLLLPGMFVHAVLKQGVQDKGLRVPQESIGHDSKGRPYVFVVTDEQTIEQRTIQTGESKDGYWVVTDGLKEGERVVTSGVQKIAPGIKVAASERKPAQEKSPSIALSMTDPSAQ